MKFIDLIARQKWENQQHLIKRPRHKTPFYYFTESITPEVEAVQARVSRWKDEGARPTKRSRSFSLKADRHQRNLGLARQSNRKYATQRKRHEQRRARAFFNAEARIEQGHTAIKPHIRIRQALTSGGR